MTSFFLTAIGGNKTNDRQTEDYYATEPAAADHSAAGANRV